ncbi:MAG: hypothetical protein AAF311_12760 [Pseudomonadota bacterium]
MAYLTALPKAQLEGSEIGALARQVYRKMDFVPTTVELLAADEPLARGYLLMSREYTRMEQDQRLTFLVALATSRSAECRYCTAHAARLASMTGSSIAKVRAVIDLDLDSDAFTEKERAVCRFGVAAGRIPNEVEVAHYEALAEHISEKDIRRLVGTIAMMGFLNRFNDTVASPLEPESLDFAQKHLAGTWWTPGKHATAKPPAAFLDAS